MVPEENHSLAGTLRATGRDTTTIMGKAAHLTELKHHRGADQAYREGKG